MFHVKLTDNQVVAMRSYVEGKDVFVGTRTGSGKSFIYECSKILFGKSSVCVIISLLLSIMKEQVNRLSYVGFTATYIGKKDCNIDDVTQGYYQFVFGSP